MKLKGGIIEMSNTPGMSGSGALIVKSQVLLPILPHFIVGDSGVESGLYLESCTPSVTCSWHSIKYDKYNETYIFTIFIKLKVQKCKYLLV